MLNWIIDALFHTIQCYSWSINLTLILNIATKVTSSSIYSNISTKVLIELLCRCQMMKLQTRYKTPLMKSSSIMIVDNLYYLILLLIFFNYKLRFIYFLFLSGISQHVNQCGIFLHLIYIWDGMLFKSWTFICLMIKLFVLEIKKKWLCSY